MADNYAGYQTNTSFWTLAIHRVSAHSAEIWVGTLFPTLKMPAVARIILRRQGKIVSTLEIVKNQWQRPFSDHGVRFYRLETLEGLQPGCHYDVSFERQLPEIESDTGAVWQLLKQGSFETLPQSLPNKSEQPFTIMLASCYFAHRDNGQAALAYKALYESASSKMKPTVKILTGDQVYLDIGLDSISFDPKEIRQRIADDYAHHWQALGSLLARGGSWMLPDDHEYWNDFPFVNKSNPFLWALNIDTVKTAWHQAAIDGVRNIQQVRPLNTFSIGDELSVCLIDTRTDRNEDHFCSMASLTGLCDWIAGLRGPGILVLSQPLISVAGEGERNLANYSSDMQTLLQAIAICPHKLVVLSGDVHFGRIASVQIGLCQVTEIIASPLSNLTGLSGLAVDTANKKPSRFPAANLGEPIGLAPQKVSYDRDFFVSKESPEILAGYPKTRTAEHFMTISFYKNAKQQTVLEARAWKVRERNRRSSLPKADFPRPFRLLLN